MHGGQCGPRVFTGGFPLCQQNSGSAFRMDFLADSDNFMFPPHLSASGVGGSSAAVVAMPTHQESSLRYVNGKRKETRTFIRDGLMNAVCFEDGPVGLAHRGARGAREDARRISGPLQGVAALSKSRERSRFLRAVPVRRLRASAAKFDDKKSLSRKQRSAQRKQRCQNERRWQGHRFL
ncbi:hypothetical protein HPB50_009969 [Hyalomma asiaticum]|uniref:Uncharacterized protein n=1 Tax=Hyalomma asiaticum TaxID=266040 RepID=A0ACB7S1M0_HYAAI|nr:hypothetical protein HPB50_009969 [Hyalomma asiaticum]